jgi:endonuclease YncB( thermonuclease family)
VDLIEPRRDKYFRLLAHIVVDGRDLSEILKAGGLAMPYAGGRKASQWCA